MSSSYFYNGQTRRFLQQFIRLLNNFEVELGKVNGQRTLLKVPVYYGDSSRQVASIIAKNSENTMASVPAMSVYINALRYDRVRVQEPHHVSKMNLRERAYDPETGNYTQFQGDLVTIERLMPVPYTLGLKVDIWTSNTDQKLQLIEQISVLFNPSLEIQSSDSYVDWTALTVVTLMDINFSSRTVPVGTEEPIDVATLTFEIPIWYSTPAKVKRMGVIHKILQNIWDPEEINHEGQYFDLGDSMFVTKRVLTPIDLNVVYEGNTLKLYKSTNDLEFNEDVDPTLYPSNWLTAIKDFGELVGTPNKPMLVNGLSQIILDNDGARIVGTVAYHPTDNSVLLYDVDIDTLPGNNLDPVDAIIDPFTVKVDSSILTPALGTRYLILNDIGHISNVNTSPAAWNKPGQPQLIAKANDIIEYDGNRWQVVFESATITDIKFMTNLKTNIQYKWKNQEWTQSVEGRYGVGAWSFVPNN